MDMAVAVQTAEAVISLWWYAILLVHATKIMKTEMMPMKINQTASDSV